MNNIVKFTNRVFSKIVETENYRITHKPTGVTFRLKFTDTQIIIQFRPQGQKKYSTFASRPLTDLFLTTPSLN